MLLRKELVKLYSPYITFQRCRIKNLPNWKPEPIQNSSYRNYYDLTDFYGFVQRTTLTWKEVKIWFRNRKFRQIVTEQIYPIEKYQKCGPNVSAAQFVFHHFGKVKVTGYPQWLTEKNSRENILTSYYPNVFVEEIDLSGSNLVFEGFNNISSLQKLKKLDISNCPYIDDWCLSRTYLFENSLEHLNISGCHKVTERGICALHRLRKLKTLVIQDTPNIQNKELVTLLLQDIIPTCTVFGVNYDDTALLKRVEDYVD